MQDEILERWLELCRQAATEQDHHRLLEEILRMLSEKERRLSQLANRQADSLRTRIIECLKDLGPTTSQSLATELGAPPDNVRFALEQMRVGEEKFVTLLPFGLWALLDYEEAA
jgi:hypothetical protein